MKTEKGKGIGIAKCSQDKGERKRVGKSKQCSDMMGVQDRGRAAPHWLLA
jgi:hypothetical protein